MGKALQAAEELAGRDIAVTVADARRVFEKELRAPGEATHVRLNIYPDGGVARLRIFGRRARHLR